jgi:hypothetical protein
VTQEVNDTRWNAASGSVNVADMVIPIKMELTSLFQEIRRNLV